MKDIPGFSRPLRILHRHQEGHISTTDVVLRREGDDLYVKFASQPRTMLTYLRYVWMTLMFLACFLGVMACYFFMTGSKSAWAAEYANKHSKEFYPWSDKSVFMQSMIVDGCYTTDWTIIQHGLSRDIELSKKINEYIIAIWDSLIKDGPGSQTMDMLGKMDEYSNPGKKDFNNKMKGMFDVMKKSSENMALVMRTSKYLNYPDLSIELFLNEVCGEMLDITRLATWKFSMPEDKAQGIYRLHMTTRLSHF